MNLKWRMKMQAIEFETQLCNGIIELPIQFQLWSTQTVRVIVLLDNTETPSPLGPTPKTLGNSKRDRPLGWLKGQLKVHFADDFKMTEEELLRS
jgi:hypothetical protein